MKLFAGRCDFFPSCFCFISLILSANYSQRHGEKLNDSWQDILEMLRCAFLFLQNSFCKVSSHCVHLLLFAEVLYFFFSSRSVACAAEKDLITLGFQVGGSIFFLLLCLVSPFLSLQSLKADLYSLNLFLLIIQPKLSVTLSICLEYY